MFEMTSGADWLIAGLGNPEPKYDGTRHNAGFEALDYLAAQWQCDIAKAKWQGLYGAAQVNGHKVVLLKPLTYMNLSGQSIAPPPTFTRSRQTTSLCCAMTSPRSRDICASGPRLCRRAQRAEKHHCQPGHRPFQPYPHRHRRQTEPAVRPGRLGAGQAACRRPQGHDGPLPGH